MNYAQHYLRALAINLIRENYNSVFKPKPLFSPHTKVYYQFYINNIPIEAVSDLYEFGEIDENFTYYIGVGKVIESYYMSQNYPSLMFRIEQSGHDCIDNLAYENWYYMIMSDNGLTFWVSEQQIIGLMFGKKKMDTSEVWNHFLGLRDDFSEKRTRQRTSTFDLTNVATPSLFGYMHNNEMLNTYLCTYDRNPLLLSEDVLGPWLTPESSLL